MRTEEKNLMTALVLSSWRKTWYKSVWTELVPISEMRKLNPHHDGSGQKKEKKEKSPLILLSNCTNSQLCPLTNFLLPLNLNTYCMPKGKR